MEFTNSEKSAIIDAIAFTITHLEDPNDPKACKACAGFKALTENIIKDKSNFTRSEIENICISLDLYINEYGASAAAVYKNLQARFSFLNDHR